MITNVFTPTDTATVTNVNTDTDNTMVTDTNINNVAGRRRRKRGAHGEQPKANSSRSVIHVD